MRKILYISLFAISFFKIYSQNTAGTYDTYDYKCNVGSVYKKFYSAPLNFDSITKPHPVNGQRVWRAIDLSDKGAKKFFTNNISCEFIDLFEILKFGVLTGKVNAFSSDKFGDDIFKFKIDRAKLNTMLTFKDTVADIIFNAEGNQVVTKTLVERQLNSDDLVGYLFCEDWYVDRHFSNLQKRIVYFCPIYKNHKTSKEYPLFYLYYEECRDLLSSFKALNLRTLEPITFDQFILSHKYPSFFIKSSNIFDRKFTDYRRGTDIEDDQENTLKELHNKEADLFGH
ncbi:MAG: hypothetical protein ACK50L_12935 [Bacteroidota bacterium]